jgi:hypothetical protein
VPRVVQVKVEVDIVGPDTHVQHVRIERSNRRQRLDRLPQGQKGYPNKAVEVSQGLSAKPLSVSVSA